MSAKTEPAIVLGHHGPWWWRKPLVLRAGDISQHKHVIGLTGQGKSKLLASTYVQLLRQGIPAALIDPHSDLADDVLSMLNDVGYLSDPVAADKFLFVDFGRRDRYLPFNILKTRYSAHDTARHVVEVCRRVWPALGDGAAPMFENVMLFSCLTLIRNGLPITQIPRLITDKPFRDMLLSNVRDPNAIHFFRASFDNLRPVDQLDQAQSSLRRVFLLTFSETLRYSLGQPENLLDFRRMMDQGVSVVYDLGGLDEDTQRFLGCLLTVGYEVAALSRADQPLRERKPYHLFMDEFSQFSATSEEGLARILSLARKYQLSLVMAHQTWSQVSARLQGALQNTTSVAFKLGRSDAEWMAKRLARWDPTEVRHVVSDEHAQVRTHPVFFNPSETFERLTTQLETLVPRRAIVQLGGHVHEVETPTVANPKTTQAELERIKEGFAARLLTRRQRAVALVDSAGGSIDEGPPRS